MKKVLIVGAGIAGCSAALALAQRGWQVEVIEKQPQWRFRSSGIFVYSNGLDHFRQIGAMQDLVEAGFPIASGRNVYLDQDGRHLVDVVYPSLGSPPAPAILGIKRAEMHRVLSGRLDALGVPVRLGTTVLSLRQDEGPGAFPGAAGDIGADAPTLIRADLLLVVRVEDRIGEDQQIAGTVAFRQLVDDGIGFGPLDDRERDHAIDRGGIDRAHRCRRRGR